jgi:hypothetical protein
VAARRGRRGRAAAATALAIWAAAARGEGLGARLEESYSNTDSKLTDQAGNVTRTESTSLLQRARGSYGRALFPKLRLDADGLYEWNLGWSRSDGPTSKVDARRWSAGGRLTFGDDYLGAGLSYERREEWSDVRTGADSLHSPKLIRDVYGAYAAWKPADLPTLELRAGRTHQRDAARASADLVTDDVQLATAYRPARPLDLRYSIRWGDGNDRLRGVETTDVSQSGTVTWGDSFLDGRITGYASYSAGTRTSRTTVTGTGGVVLTQVLPVGGLSAIEGPLDTPDRVRLVSNPRLADGDAGAGDGGTGSSAGLDLGTGPSASGDIAPRDIGAQFPDLIHPVNTIYVWVNKPLPAGVVSSYLFTAWQSDDNQTWTPVAISGPVQFGLFQTRFEIPVAQTAARYLKVTVRPLAVSATTDPRYASVLVTEVQFFLGESAATVAARGSPTILSGQLNASGRAMIVRDYNLAYDTSLTYTHADHPWHATWNLSNALSASRRLGRIVGTSARIERTDSDAGQGREGSFRWGGSLTVDPLPTLGAGLSYGGSWTERRAGDLRTQSLTAFGRADLYRGLSVFTSAGGTLGRNESGQDTQGLNFSAGTTMTPHRTLTLNGTYSRAISTASGGGKPTTRDDKSLVEGSGSFSPFPALSMSASVTRYLTGQTPSTLASFNAGFSPFPGGQLQMRFFYSETLDTAADQRTRIWGPGARWNVRQGLTLEASYTVNDSRTPAQDQLSKIFFASLNVSLL